MGLVSAIALIIAGCTLLWIVIEVLAEYVSKLDDINRQKD